MSTEDMEVHSEGVTRVLGAMDKVDQDMEMFEGDDFNQQDHQQDIWEGNIENLESIDGSEVLAQRFQDLPNELILKVLSYSRPKDLIRSGQVSKRLRMISNDKSLWQRVNLSTEIVKTDFLDHILSKECKRLNLGYSTILGNLSLDNKSQLRELSLEECFTTNVGVIEEILASCCSLKKLIMPESSMTPKMAASICQNSKTLQILDLYQCDGDQSGYLQIIKCCQELKQLDLQNGFPDEELSDECLEFIATHVSQNVETLDLSDLPIKDNHIKVLLIRCKKIKTLSLCATMITDISLQMIRKNLNTTLNELSLMIHVDEDKNFWSFTGLLKLKDMPRLRILNLHGENEEEDFLNLFLLREQLPHLTINHHYRDF